MEFNSLEARGVAVCKTVARGDRAHACLFGLFGVQKQKLKCKIQSASKAASKRSAVFFVASLLQTGVATQKVRAGPYCHGGAAACLGMCREIFVSQPSPRGACTLGTGLPKPGAVAHSHSGPSR